MLTLGLLTYWDLYSASEYSAFLHVLILFTSNERTALFFGLNTILAILGYDYKHVGSGTCTSKLEDTCMNSESMSLLRKTSLEQDDVKEEFETTEVTAVLPIDDDISSNSLVQADDAVKNTPTPSLPFVMVKCRKMEGFAEGITDGKVIQQLLMQSGDVESNPGPEGKA